MILDMRSLWNLVYRNSCFVSYLLMIIESYIGCSEYREMHMENEVPYLIGILVHSRSSLKGGSMWHLRKFFVQV